MISAQDVEMSSTANIPSQDSFPPDNQIPSKYVTPGFKLFLIHYQYVCQSAVLSLSFSSAGKGQFLTAIF